MGNSSVSITYIYISLWTTKHVYGQLKTSPTRTWTTCNLGLSGHGEKTSIFFVIHRTGKMMINKKIFGGSQCSDKAI